ncbi:MAG: beta-phosphoglucomutase [Flavobacteriales bacterium]|nr:beta-phosphoglucomutase [Flavobacteriales bacterium]
MIKGLIFDLDGVIVDTAHYHYLSWREISRDLNIDFTIKDNENLKGVSRIDSLNYILKLGSLSFNTEEKNNLLDKKNNIYKHSISSLGKKNILKGVEKILSKAKEKKMLLAVGSSSKNAKMIVEKLNLTHLFQAVVDGTMVKKTKPDPEVFLKAAKKMNLKPSECIVFEDAESGVIAAKKGGFHVVSVGNINIRNIGDVYVESLEDFNLDYYAKYF